MLKIHPSYNIIGLFSNILRFLRYPFPPPSRSLKKFISIIIFGLSCTGFIILFNPFDIAEYAHLFKIKMILILQGLVFSFSIIFMDLVMPIIIPYIFKKWNVWKALLWYSLIIIFSSFINFLYKSYWNDFYDFKLDEFFNVLYSTSVIGIPIALVFLGVYRFFNKGQIPKLIDNNDSLIKMENDQDFKIDLNSILYISSNDNYVNIHYLKNGAKQKAIFRTTLKSIEKQIVYPFSPILRCHRQFLINKEHFEIEKASSRSITLSLKIYTDKVGVSSKYVQLIKKELAHS